MVHRKVKRYNYTYIYNVFIQSVGQNSSVGIATAYGLDGPGIESELWYGVVVHRNTAVEVTSEQKVQCCDS
jgi:hypothetical protein